MQHLSHAVLAKCSADSTQSLSLVVLAKYGAYRTVFAKCSSYHMKSLPLAVLAKYGTYNTQCLPNAEPATCSPYHR